MPENEEEKMTLDKLALIGGHGFDAVDKHLDGMDGRLSGVEAGIAVLTVDMQEVKKRLDKIERISAAPQAH
jgi:hypothetical protein